MTASHESLGKLVIIVDDDEDQRSEMLFSVEALGFRGLAFATGEEMLGALLDEPPHVVLLDINLYARDGIRIAEMATHLNHKVRICLLSGSAERCREARDRQLGEVFEKPVSLELLRHIL
ncbi:MAG: response regulator receiver protein [Sphingomonadales bacterium]|nr:response regulator receiver protein [Sphingomonadales bacterium]